MQGSCHQVNKVANEANGRTAQVNLPWSLVALFLPTFPVPQVDLKVNMEIVYGECRFFALQVLQEDAIYSVYVICHYITAF